MFKITIVILLLLSGCSVLLPTQLEANKDDMYYYKLRGVATSDTLYFPPRDSLIGDIVVYQYDIGLNLVVLSIDTDWRYKEGIVIVRYNKQEITPVLYTMFIYERRY